jgi:hypothetical protein
MNRQSIREYVKVMRERYVLASKKGKGKLLDEACQVIKCHRKSAVRLLRAPKTTQAKRTGRPRKYPEHLVPHLVKAWETTDRICSQRLAPFLPELLTCLVRHGEMQIEDGTRQLLEKISASTIDRMLRPHRQKLGRQPRGGAHSQASIRDKVPIRGYWSWRSEPVGSLQSDLVLHCGESTLGFFLRSLVAVDVKTSWVSLRPVWGGGQQRVAGAMENIRRELPFQLKALHTDNGGEFLNHLLVPWSEQMKIKMSRGRPNKKNDQAYVEQRNWQIVRKLAGWERYCTKESYAAMEELYKAAALYFNFFQPTAKVVMRMAVSATTDPRQAKIRTTIDPAKTPYRRLCDSGAMSPEKAQSLEAHYLRLNPVKLRAEIQTLSERLWQCARKDVAQPKELPDAAASASAG